MVGRMDAAVFDAFGQEALFNERKVVRIVIDKDVIRVNDNGEAMRNAYEISLPAGTAVTLNDTFRTREHTFVVTEILNDDGAVLRYAAAKK